MSRNIKISTGAFAVILVVSGIFGRLLFVLLRDRGYRMEVVADLVSGKSLLGFISVVVLFVGRVLGVYGYLKDDGKALSALATLLAVIAFLCLFVKGAL